MFLSATWGETQMNNHLWMSNYSIIKVQALEIDEGLWDSSIFYYWFNLLYFSPRLDPSHVALGHFTKLFKNDNILINNYCFL